MITESEIKENFNVDLWKRWVEGSVPLFKGLLDGSIIGMLIGENEEQILLLEKKDGNMTVKIENPEDLERPVSDILFRIGENNVKEILEDNSSAKFMELVLNQEIRVYGLRSQAELIDKGYRGFLDRLGLGLGGSCCGGGGCC